MTPPCINKNFFCKNFHLSFSFHNKGGVSGTLSHVSNDLVFEKMFNGLYSMEDAGIKLGFIVDWNDPNLVSQTLTTFTGTIFNYDEISECLILRWLKVVGPATWISNTLEEDFEVLFNCSKKDPYLETKKILQHFPFNIFK